VNGAGQLPPRRRRRLHRRRLPRMQVASACVCQCVRACVRACVRVCVCAHVRACDLDGVWSQRGESRGISFLRLSQRGCTDGWVGLWGQEMERLEGCESLEGGIGNECGVKTQGVSHFRLSSEFELHSSHFTVFLPFHWHYTQSFALMRLA
jgi:hypothetical protein